MHSAISCLALFYGAWAPLGFCAAADSIGESAMPRQETGDSAHDTATQLPTMEVIGKADALPPAYAGGQVASGTRLGILGNTGFMDAPFNTTGYTALHIENAQARTLQDVLGADPTVRFQYPPGALVESMTIRGFTYNINNSNLNGMPGMAPAFSVGAEMLERIEVLRGPSAFLDGLNIGSEPNGGVNMVFKRPLPGSLTRLTVDYATRSQLGAHLDFSRRFGPENRFGLRFNGAVRNGDTAIDAQQAGRVLGTLALDYVGKRGRINLDTYRIKNEFDGAGTFLVQALNRTASNLTIPTPAPDYKTGIDGLSGEQESQGTMLQGEYRFSESLSGYAGAGYAETRASGFYGGGTILNPDAAGRGTLALSYSNARLEKTAYQAGLRARFTTGPIRHQAVLGWSRLDLAQFQLNGSVPGSTASLPGVSIYAPAFDTARIPQVKPPAPKLQEQSLSSLAIADTLDFGNGLVRITGGIRHQNVIMDTFNQTTGSAVTHYDRSVLSPMFGLVIKPLAERDRLSLYYNYIEGLQRGPTAPANAAYVNAGEVFAPYQSRQSELGVKWNTGRFANTLSLYQITRPSFITRPVDGRRFLYAEDGKQRNRGIEWLFFGELSKSVRLLGGLAYTRTKLLKTANGVNQGNAAGGYPKWQGNVGVEWDAFFQPGLTLLARANFNGPMYANNANTRRIPGWATFDLGLRYRTTGWRRLPITLRLNVDNAFDRQGFWAGARAEGVFYVMPGRTVKLSASMDF